MANHYEFYREHGYGAIIGLKRRDKEVIFYLVLVEEKAVLDPDRQDQGLKAEATADGLEARIGSLLQ